MAKIPRLFYHPATQILFYLGLPAFYILFVLLYEPQFIVDFYSKGKLLLPVNVVLVSAIQLLVIALLRNLLFLLRHHLNLNWLNYIGWCLAELIISALFMGLYMTLISEGEYLYFTAVGYSAASLLLVWTYPYVIFSLALSFMEQKSEVKEESLIRFVDSTGRLKCVINVNSILYIEANENYVLIRYVEADNIREYQLRNSMKSIEQLVLRSGIVRCQRSYYINPKRIKVLRRDKDGMIQAELDVQSKPIPVSPKYYDSLSRLL
ncbi:MAG: LytTR family transcriptional regulator [Paludibacteraceae bacterium]|nr:LytTR family transcriptional regulator [Paludibacteraceae bacterium]